jgi:hypothetical protein
MVSPLVIADSSRIGNSSIRITRSLDLIAILYVSRDGFPTAGRASRDVIGRPLAWGSERAPNALKAKNPNVYWQASQNPWR